jgi:dihydrofolate synthase/folylpolyglutamate synthase
MADHARSTAPAVQTQLDRLAALSPGRDTLGLERITALCARLGNPQDRLPPVFHVAGTNGKGSTCAFLRAMLEASGRTVHVFTSPHLVRFNERIRLAGTLISDDDLAATLARVLDVADGLDASFFEITTAAAFLRFSEVPADACVIEVGLGGRLDATNIIARPLVTGIASLGIDHKEFLLSPDADVALMPDLERIAFEKAGIAKPGVPLVRYPYPPDLNDRIRHWAESAGASFETFELDDVSRSFLPYPSPGTIYQDKLGQVVFSPPRLTGDHQIGNAALAIGMIRHQSRLHVPIAAIHTGLATARWPARLQRLRDGPLTRRVAGRVTYLDGGHNPDAGRAIGSFLASYSAVDVVIGMLANKDVAGFLAPMLPSIKRLRAVPVPGHAHHAPQDLCALARDQLGIADAQSMPDLPAALDSLQKPDRPSITLICGSLYLAGEALRLNNEPPD